MRKCYPEVYYGLSYAPPDSEALRGAVGAWRGIVMQGADPQIEAGEPEERDFDLRLVVEDVLDLLAEPAERRGLHLGGLVAHNVPARLRGDPARLRQVLTHLVGNALTFTRRGEVLVRAELAGQTDGEITLRVAVSDTGVGIPAAAQARLFAPLAPADGVTPRLSGGLAICRQLVSEMGGAIALESAPGAGSTFSFTARMRPAALVEPARVDLSGARALIVDDSPASRTLLSHMLAGWDMRPAAEGDAVAALRALRAAAAAGQPFDVAIIDVVMPDQDGLALAQAIAADPLTARLPVILVSAFSLHDFGPAAQAAGAAAFLTKPIRGSQLFGSLVRALAPGDSQRPRPEPAPPAPDLRIGRVLVAEDNAISRRVAMRMLERLGCRADGAADGREALTATAQIVYDLVLMDCHMPEMDGFAATAAIRAREAGRRRTTIIALTADALTGEQERCLAAGMDDCLAKPITHEGLLAVLDRWLPPRQPAPAPATPPPPPAFDRAAFALVLGAAPEAEPELAVELIDLFLRYAPQTRDELAQSVAESSLAAVRLHAHTLKGAAANLGLAALRQRCAELEALAGGGQPAGVGAAYAALADAYSAALAALRELRVELARPPPAG